MNPVYIQVVREPLSSMLEPDLDLRPRVSQIQFHMRRADLPPYDEDSRYLYACYSCYAACGDLDACFKTDAAPLKSMKNNPTDKQTGQMQEHAEQHSIIWSWARQQDKR